MISSILLFTALVFNSLVGGLDRAKISLVCLIPSASYLLIKSVTDLDGLSFFLLAASISLTVIVSLEYLPKSPLSTDIQLINLGAIFVHSFGYGMWYAYYEPVYYDVLIMAVIIIEWLRLMIRTRRDGIYRANHWMRSLRANDTSGPMGGSAK